MASAPKVKLREGSDTEEVLVQYCFGKPRNSGTAKFVQIKVEKNLKLMFEGQEFVPVLGAVHFYRAPVQNLVDLEQN